MHFTQIIACSIIVYYKFTNVYVFVTSRAAISYNFYIRNYEIIGCSLRNSCKRTSISGKKPTF